MIKNILIIGHSNIGDVCYDMVVVNPIRRHFPQAKIYFLTSSRCKDIADGYKGLDRIINYDRSGKDKGFFRQIMFISELRKIRFDMALVLKKSARHVFLRVDKIWSVDKIKSHNLHPVERYLKLLRDNGVSTNSAQFDFALAENERIFCQNFLKEKGIGPNDKLAGILLLAAWSLKSWPIERWNELAKTLTHKFNFKVIALGKAPDNDLGRRVSKAISNEIIMADKTTLKQAIALIKRCSLFIGPDSSFIHLASCMGVKTIGLYGPTSIDCFFPYFHYDNIVLASKKLDCMPCYPGNRPVCTNDRESPDFGPCMEGIKVEDVLSKI